MCYLLCKFSSIAFNDLNKFNHILCIFVWGHVYVVCIYCVNILFGCLVTSHLFGCRDTVCTTAESSKVIVVRIAWDFASEWRSVTLTLVDALALTD